MYVNYFFQGIASIIISQNLHAFQMRWSASISQVSLVVSAIGLGRLLSLNFSGWFSDRFGRKYTVLLGVLANVFFFVGLVCTKHYLQAFFAALFAGVGNAFLDTSTYPVVNEAFPKEQDNSALSVMNKAFISLGQFILPFVVRWSLHNDIYFGWPFWFCAVGLLLNFCFLLRFSYPDSQAILNKIIVAHEVPKAKIQLEGLALLIFSFVSVSLFNIFVLWIPTFAQETLGVSEENSLLFVSVYSISSLISVFVTSFIVKQKVSIPDLILLCLFLSGGAMLYMLLFPSYLSLIVTSLAVGIFAAGGIWQLGLSVLLEFFPGSKGIVTSFYSFATAVSVMLTPYVTGLMAEKSTYLTFAYNIVLAFIGFLAILVVKVRYTKILKNKGLSSFSLKNGDYKK
ncbi:MFS transporter [Streptococcus pantholopis]|uniref:MFS transporter n=1 Tax=Streptococcus pantholopis TaxID=1811193 RepID=UPI000ACC419D|nr:MFS transporter [Streptococcus pantholopis]